MYQDLESELGGLSFRANIAVALAVIYAALIVLDLAVLTWLLIDPQSISNQVTIIPFLDSMPVLSQATFILSAIAVCFWIHQAHKNLFTADVGGLEFTPGWSIGWFAVPFANLVMPYRAMRELWERSLAGSGSPVGFWWGAYLLGNIITRISNSSAFQDNPPLLMAAIGEAALLASAMLLMLIIRRVTAAQREGIRIESIFE
ncbi:MAG: DUF4328 domain-containing protein [Sphingopyxis sp.]